MNFSQRIKELRLEAGYTQFQLAQQLGVTSSSIRKYESNQGKPRAKNLEELAKIFNVSVSYLLGETDVRSSSNLANVSSFSKRVKELRLEAGYTQAKLAEQLGITRAAYSSYGIETTPTFPRTEHLEQLARTLNVSVSYLIGEIDERPEFEQLKPQGFPERLQYLRKKAGYKQTDLAKLLDLSSRQAISNYERGLNKPQKETLEKLAQIFDVSIEYLLDAPNEAKPLDSDNV